ncbi:glycosyl transferase family protein [Roseovarius sp.]|uniref:glycosyl transferase family protein n=1 Tax=Roseovarius sp. TaxID=1486281 RepID=UPI002638E199|nr:glycosyl transferase family protein [Roseovarius sp.]MDM8167558.1 glycosyl transferase family protein [Roseovarius sp.]
MTLSDHVRTLGRGPGRSRSLTRDEARDAMRLMLSGQAAPEAVGALLMLLRMKGETADEIAGLAEAATAAAPALPPVDLDWPSYAAGRTRGQPWFLLSARLVADAGHRVLLHGWNGPHGKLRDGLAEAGIGIATRPDAAARLLDRDRIAYMPLDHLHPELFRLLALRDALGLRSCVNTVCRMLNPTGAPASVQGVFHPSYRLLQSDAAARLGWDALSVIKGGGGEFERNPAKEIAAFGLRAGRAWDGTLAATNDETRRLSDSAALSLTDLWQGRHTAAFETEVILETAALALDTLGDGNAAARARTLWQSRAARRAA